MSRWFIGCGLVALVAAAILGWFAYSFVEKLTESSTVDQEARARYREAAIAHPFILTGGKAFDDSRLDIYLAARRIAADTARLHLASVESSQGPNRLTTMYQGYAETARAHAAALEQDGMSPDEYRFFDQEIAVLLAEADPAFEPLRAAREALVRRLESLEARNVSKLAEFPLVPLVRSGRIVIPAADRERLSARVADLVATSDALLIELFADLAGTLDFGK
jgi:hypothetical protein